MRLGGSGAALSGYQLRRRHVRLSETELRQRAFVGSRELSVRQRPFERHVAGAFALEAGERLNVERLELAATLSFHEHRDGM